MELRERIADPARHYRRPVAVLADKELTAEERIIALKNWRNDIDLRLLATSENMGDSVEDPTLIDEINDLLSFLES